ncbi:amino acid adenylation domain-containing protein [Paenibacillus sp. NPDC056933]|uniref:amino acid adenylation domain-containing protein n=1 Tax=Paenibacillus sp. NPDC056933 TaxID=3345968 RepID=UPI00362FC57F
MNESVDEAIYSNKILARSVAAYIGERIKRDATDRLKILEIGASSGEVSRTVLQNIDCYRDFIEEYSLTDISQAYIHQAMENNNSSFPYLICRTFTIDSDPSEQGFSKGEYDLMIAGGTYLAKGSIKSAVRNTKKLLKRNGWLVIYENAPVSTSEMPERWTAILESEGYRIVRHSLQSEAHLVIAASDGMIRISEPVHGHLKTGTEAETRNRVEESSLSLQLNVNRTSPTQKSMVSKQDDSYLEIRVVDTIIGKLMETLHIKEQLIDPERPFTDYGLDSITGVQFIQQLNEYLQIDLETTCLFDYSSVLGLAAYIVTRYNERLLSLYQADDRFTESELVSDEVNHSVLEDVDRHEKGIDKQRSSSGVNKKGASQGGVHSKEPIAVIGMSGRFAKSETLEQLWEHLAEGHDLIEKVTRWNLEEYMSGDYCDYGSFLDNIDRFDPLFFNISGAEASYMDPQQRFFLEESYKALEDAGYAGTQIQGRSCGVYVGYNGADYDRLIGPDAPPQAMWGNSASIIPARISYHLNLRGPAITVDTACSSSLVAIHLACQGLWSGETEMALAGGVFIQTTPGFYISANRAGMFSQSGRCRTFDERADGFVPGEGVAVVVLKKLEAAMADGDHIYGVIRGSGMNQDGATNGITAPSALAQERLQRDVYDTFGIDPSAIELVEAHGTGTKLGDPIEHQALTKAFRAYTDQREYCAIGSIKTNIGHTTSVAGIAGFIKVLLSLKNRQIPPSLHFEKHNPNIDLAGSPFYVNTRLQHWESPSLGARRLGAVSSFGFSGTNAHIVLEEAPERETKSISKPAHLIVLSAATEGQLREQAEQIVSYCEKPGTKYCSHMSFTLLVGRKHLSNRLALIVRNEDELRSTLSQWLEGVTSPRLFVTTKSETVATRERPSLRRIGNQCIRNSLISDDVREYIDNLEVVAELFIQGYKLDYEVLFSNDHYSRVSMPTYPFAKESYWVSDAKASPSGYVSNTVVRFDPSSAGIEHAEPGSSGIPSEGTDERLLKLVSSILRITVDRIDDKQDLFSYGLDSISGMSLMNGVKEEFGVEMSYKELLNYRSVQEIAEYILKNTQSGPQDCLQPDCEMANVSLEETLRFPLSSGQLGIWLIQQLAPTSYAYNLPHAFRIKQKIDSDALYKAVNGIVNRHLLLRAVIEMNGTEAVHAIYPENRFLYETEHVSHLSDEELNAYLIQKSREPFQLEKGPLLRVCLLTKTEDEHILFINVHHIVFDGSSLMVLLKELLLLYAKALNGDSMVLAGPEVTYKAFVDWQQNFLGSETGQRQQAYWRTQLSGETPTLQLPYDRPRPETSNFQGKTYIQRLDEALTQNVHQGSVKEKVSPYIFMLSTFKMLLHHYTGQTDIAVGTALRGRQEKQFNDVIGYFANIVMIRSEVTSELHFGDFVKQVQSKTYDALEHGNYPFAEVVKEMQGKTNRGDAPIVQAAFVFQNWLKPEDLLQNGEESINENSLLMLEPIHEIHQEGEFDISFEVYYIDNRYSIFIKYNPDLFNESTIEQIGGHYEQLLHEMSTGSDKLVGEVDFLSEAERSLLLSEWNDTESNYPDDKCIHQLFKEKVKLFPDQTAVSCKSRSLTYKELHKRSNQMARVLKKAGVKRGTIVAVAAKRSSELMIALYGILKAGGAYLPIDPDYPAERIEYILSNSEASVLLMLEPLGCEFSFSGERILYDKNVLLSMGDEELNNINKPNDLAYIIYTSGSTGKPKGVMIEHRSVINRLKWMQKVYCLTSDDTILQKTPFTFDVSVWELFWWSLEGGKLYMLDAGAEKDPHLIAQAIEEQGITVMHFVPSMLNNFLQYITGFSSINKLSHLRQVFVSGEVLTGAQAKLFHQTLHQAYGTRLMNLYGPTEATIDVSYYDCTASDSLLRIPIGRPIDNTSLYILNSHNRLQPVGIPGELCIAGVSVARGYVNNAELTDAKFVPNPFVLGTKMYRTGDLARWLPDGNIEYLGRMDRQVKIRGHRIELGEIEAVLSSYEQVKEAHVMVSPKKDMSGNMQLLAFICAKEADILSTESIKQYLRGMLPEYMVPAYFVQMDAMPLTVHGKIDMHSLAAHALDIYPKASISKVDETDTQIKQQIMAVYREVLQLDDINPVDNFFDLGGHSMLLVTAAIKLKDVLNREITTVDMFKYPTVESLTRYLSKTETVNPFDRSKQKAKRQREILMKMSQARTK